jgi:CRP/FNR family transcriptional regulator, anaerobic regulatory protein
MNAAVQNIIVLKNGDRPESVSACQACTKRTQCPVAGIDTGNQVAHRVVQSGTSLYDAGGRFDGVYIVRSGFFKSYSIDSDGERQITGFYLPGDFVGMDGIESGQYGDYVEALDTSSVCRIPLSLFTEARAATQTAAQGSMMLMLVKLMSRTLAGDRRMFSTLGKMTARRRVGEFLKDLSERMAKSGYSATEFTLCMSRTDIANYLCLALETVSRLITQMHAEGTIAIDRRHIRLLDMDALVRDDFQEKVRKAG